jgi:glycosyltransferase involved in cell wall biosynthesis
VIDDGVTGVIVNRWRDMGSALERADAIDPLVQRRVVEERFSPQRMVADYVAAYEKTIERWAAPSAAPHP